MHSCFWFWLKTVLSKSVNVDGCMSWYFPYDANFIKKVFTNSCPANCKITAQFSATIGCRSTQQFPSFWERIHPEYYFLQITIFKCRVKRDFFEYNYLSRNSKLCMLLLGYPNIGSLFHLFVNITTLSVYGVDAWIFLHFLLMYIYIYNMLWFEQVE